MLSVRWSRALRERRKPPEASVTATQSPPPGPGADQTKIEPLANEPSEEVSPTEKFTLPVWIIFVAAIYLTVGFAEPAQTGRESLPWVALLVGVSFVFATIIYWLRRQLARRNPDAPKMAAVLYGFLLLLVGWLGWNVVHPFAGKLVDLVAVSGLPVVILALFLMTLGWLSYRALFPRPELSKGEHRGYMAVRAALGVPIYYLCVLTFAYGMYPFMSVSKAGGYFAGSEFVRLAVRQTRDVRQIMHGSDSRPQPDTAARQVEGSQAPLEVLPAELMASDILSKPLVLLEENSSTVFVADPNDPPGDHGGSAGVRCWTDFQCRPRVFEIQLSNLSRIEHLPVGKGQK